jgi:hypothetical protein
MRRVIKICSVVMVITMWCGAGHAGQRDPLVDLLIQKGILTEAEVQVMESEVISQSPVRQPRIVPPTGSETTSLPAWIDGLKWAGDIRLRNEFRDRSSGEVNRQRIRFRYGFKKQINEEISVGARLATGSLKDPTSTNQSFNGGFNKKSFNLDSAWVQYAPALDVFSEFHLIGGVMPNQFFKPSSLVWDGDLKFDGVATHAAIVVGAADLFVNSGVFLIDTDESETGSLFSIQVGSRIALGEETTLTTAVAYHDYANVATATKSGTDFGPAGGNNTDLKVLGDLDFINPNVQIATKLGDVPLKAFVDWTHNTDAKDEANGYAIGFKVGKAKKPWSLSEGIEGSYMWQRLESNAAYGRFVDSDFHGGGTNGQGHKYGLKFAVLKNSTFGLTIFDTEEILGNDAHVKTLQADWITKF